MHFRLKYYTLWEARNGYGVLIRFNDNRIFTVDSRKWPRRLEILDRFAVDSIQSVMMQARLHQIEYSYFAKSEIKKITMCYIPNAAELFQEAMVETYRQLDIREVAIVSNPKKLEECKKLMKEW
jgi:hypothetical protein